jgi:hypothetical protein
MIYIKMCFGGKWEVTLPPLASENNYNPPSKAVRNMEAPISILNAWHNVKGQIHIYMYGRNNGSIPFNLVDTFIPSYGQRQK